MSASTATSADSSDKNDIYIGIDVFIGDNTFSSKTGRLSKDIDNGSDGVKIKIGARFAETWRIQAYYQSESYDDPVYGGNNNLNELGADAIKAFTTTTNLSPFFQAGVSFGRMKIEDASDNYANEISMKIGGGIFYRFSAHFEGMAGIDLQGRNWSDVKMLGTTVVRSEGSLKYYIGANYFF